MPAWSEAVDGALALLQGLDTTAVADAAFFGPMDASDFAGRVEDHSRTLEYLQLVAAVAVERSRDHASPTDPPPHVDPRQVPRRNSYFRLECRLECRRAQLRKPA